MHGFGLGLVDPTLAAFRSEHRTTEEKLNEGIGWGWLGNEHLPTFELPNELDEACECVDLIKLNPEWGKLTPHGVDKGRWRPVTPGYLLAQVTGLHEPQPGVTAYHIHIYHVGGWIIMHATWGPFEVTTMTPEPSQADWNEAFSLVAEKFGHEVASLVLSKEDRFEY